MLPGVYLHYPFCERKCPYCDFYTFGREHPQHARTSDFIGALVDEIRSFPRRMGLESGLLIETLYFGGGTPSLMGPAAMAQLLSALREVFTLAEANEWTLEVNPTTAEAADLPGMLALGINRFSVGAQSFNDGLLRQLGRVHDAATTRRALDLMRRAGVSNLSLDLIFGVPGQTLAMFDADLTALLDWAPEHISAYNLTLHRGTPFARWHEEGRLVLPPEDDQLAMFEHLIARLAAAGYEHYEISNWARPGFAARHNSKYWHACDIFALGPSAHGVIGGARYANHADLKQYLELATRELAVPQDPPANERARCGEIMMLALRRVAGAPWAELDAWMRHSARDTYRREFEQLAATGLLTIDGSGPRLTSRGLLISDTVFEAFF